MFMMQLGEIHFNPAYEKIGSIKVPACCQTIPCAFDKCRASFLPTLFTQIQPESQSWPYIKGERAKFAFHSKQTRRKEERNFVTE